MPTVDIHRRTLSNGLRVVVCPDHGAPTVTVNVTYRVGSHDEWPARTGLAHLFEHLMFDNTSTGLEKQYDLYCTKAGGSNNAYTTFDHTTYFINLPSHQVELGFWLEAERMRDFMITEHALTTQKSVVIEEIKQNVENQPYGRWRTATEEAAYTPDCHYHWEVYGSSEHVASVSMDDARTFYEKYYRPSNAALVVAGDVTPDVAFDMAERHFGHIVSPSASIERTAYEDAWRVSGAHSVVPDAVPMPAVFISFHMPGFFDTASYSAEIAAMVLGSGRTSPLYKHLVNDLRIASSAMAFFDRRANTSLLTIYAHANEESVTADQLAAAVMEAIQGYTCTEEDFEKASNRIRTALAAEIQRNEGVADSVASYTVFFDDPGLVNTVLDNYTAQTRESVQAMIDRCRSIDDGIRVDVVPNT